MNKKFSAYHICLIALAVVINIVGGQIALLLRLPIYLDCIGTLFVAAVLGPVYGMIPNLLSGIIFGMTTDIYSLYFAPVGIVLGLVAGFVLKNRKEKLSWIFLAALLITVPATIVSSCISAYLFGGVTSSGSSMIVQLLAKTPLGLTASVFIVQFFTDYIDRLVALSAVSLLLKKLPKNLLKK